MKKNTNNILTITSITLVLSLFAFAGTIDNFIGESNPFNVTLVGNVSQNFSLSFPRYSFAVNISLNITVINTTLFSDFGYCYQEDFNTSACGNIAFDNFSYSTQAPAIINPDNVIDSDYDTYGNPANSVWQEWNISYAKPSNYTGALWQIKDINLVQNLTVPLICFDHSNSTLDFRIRARSSAPDQQVAWYCVADTYQLLYNGTGNERIYEEAIFWTNFSDLGNFSVSLGNLNSNFQHQPSSILLPLFISLNSSLITEILQKNCVENGTNLNGNACEIPLIFKISNNASIQVELTNSTIFTNLTVNIFDVETDFLLTQNVEIALRDFGNFTTSTGILNVNFTTEPGPHLVTASSSGYVTNQKEFTLTDINSTTVNMFLINSTSGNVGNLIVNIFDEFFNFIQGANVKLLEYDPGPDSFVEISQCFSNTNGECIFNIELNTKFYIVQATAIRDGEVLFAQSTETGEIIKLDNTVIELHLTTSEQFDLEDIFDLIITPTNTTLIDNTSFLTATFSDFTNTIHTVCIAYWLDQGLNDILLNSTCVTASAGIVGYANGFLLDRDLTYMARIYVNATNGRSTIYNEYIYEKLKGTFSSEFGFYAKLIIMALILGILGISIYLKNINIFAAGTILISFAIPFLQPNLIGGTTTVFIIILSLCILFLANKKKEL